MSSLPIQHLELCRRFKSLLPLTDPIVSEREILLDTPSSKVIGFSSSRDIFREACAFYLMHNKLLQPVSVLHVYELIDIFMGNFKGMKTMFEFTPPSVIILLGYSNFNNRRTADVINQYIAFRRTDPSLQSLIVFYKGTPKSLLSSFSGNDKLLVDRMVDLDRKAVVRREL